LFITGITEKYPNELLKNREITEGNAIGSIWRDPNLIKEWNLSETDFITVDGKVYFSIANKMFQLGYKALDELAVITYLQDKDDVKTWWNSRGGYTTIHKISSIINEDNYEQINDELVKTNILLKLFDKGFRFTTDDYKKFENFNSDKLYKYYDFILNGVFVNLQLKDVKPIYLANPDVLNNYIENCGSDLTNALSIASSSASILNYHIGNGLQKGCLHLIGGVSGEGKSNLLMPLVILPILRQNQKILIIANEENEDAFISRLLVSVINTETNKKAVTRNKLQQGGLTDEEKESVKLTVEWLTQYKDNVVFIRLTDYKVETIEKLIHKYSNMGIENVIVDTLKPSSETEDSWKTFTEDSKALFQVANKNKVRLICTTQLGISASSNVRYLNNGCIARARSIAEVAGVIFMFRRLRQDERDIDSKFYCRPYKFIKGDDGKWTKTKQFISIESDKDYIVGFLTKSRYGQDKICILYERNLAFGTLREIGFCEIREDYY
jgi:replicative DNA helicase